MEMEEEKATLVCSVCGYSFEGSIWGGRCPKCGRLVNLMDKIRCPNGNNEEFKKFIMATVKETNIRGMECPYCHKEIPAEIVGFPEIFCDTGTIVICPYCKNSVGEWGSNSEGSYWVSYKK